MARGLSWTSEETGILIARYGTGQRGDIQALLPKRNWKAIRTKAERLKLLRRFKGVLPNQNISVADLSYFAGLFDGEGSVMLRKLIRSNQAYALELSLTNTHLPTLQWIKELWGVGSIRLKKAPKSRRPAWEWRTSGNQALYVLKPTLRFLKIKKQEAEIGVAFQELKRQTRTVWGSHRPLTLVEEEQRLAKILKACRN